MNRIYAPILILFLAPTHGVLGHSNFDVMFDKIDQLNGTDLLDLAKLRVRKFNRTISILDGSMELRKDVDDRTELSVRLAYSSKGNNQFNEYPMKIAPQKICQFFNSTWREYYSYFNETTNFPEIGECPVMAKVFTVKNHILDASMFPPYMPKGLWRFSIMGHTVGQEEVIINVDVYFKLEDKGIF
ncbi:uncharacterized protein LOC129763243 [Toxorhynchites rutilus septentrionalis]|uniref:uncharacterized protein LOC129763243 n=1 Tax=Toxorhynchites rutilus septentrionalis TaxID=329112 RepID=UPI00247907DB|nr:uncharacterized protein LOC129763243 [Toxorhynchites rutilus septentrionalis]